MKWRWLWLDFLPRRLDLSAEERASVRQRAREGVSFDGQEGMGVFVIAVVLVVPWLLVVFWMSKQAVKLGLPTITPLPLALVGCWIIGVMAVGPVVARSTYRELRRRGHDVCVHCGHCVVDADTHLMDRREHVNECPVCARPRAE
jgi:hypothetical protein